jgi:hypothetical protein
VRALKEDLLTVNFLQISSKAVSVSICCHPF